MRSSGGMLNCVMIGYNVVPSNVETDANRSVFVGARILQNLTGTTITPNATQNALVGSYIFENFNDGVGIQNNAFLGSLFFPLRLVVQEMQLLITRSLVIVP